MWSLTRPTSDAVAAAIADQAPRPFSYAEVGQSRDGSPAGYDLDHNRALLGWWVALLRPHVRS